MVIWGLLLVGDPDEEEAVAHQVIHLDRAHPRRAVHGRVGQLEAGVAAGGVHQ